MTLFEIIQSYCPPIEELLRRSSGITYEAMFLEPHLKALPPGDAKIEVMHEILQTYTRGIIERSHLSCITSLARAHRWLTASGQMADAGNILAFSAALRGFLEGAADAFDLMEKLPITIAKSSKYCFVVLNDPRAMGNSGVFFEALENLLIHYTYAGNVPKGTNPLPHHAKKTNADYIKKIEEFGVPGAKDLYAETCELTHPASPSVLCFVEQNKNSLIFNPGRDQELIADLVARHRVTILRLAQYSINPALITLSLLNRLIPAYPAMPDSAMSSIGNTSELLGAFDAFVAGYNSREFDPMTILKELSQ